ncbi:hypothetical protein HNQ93_001003 [Hymenobacter luteus]|uniref:Uncharacterized protein n=2 Tax=Hymenobacter TaxID=89966 RepID=A0A7W9SZZ3_9BACT|nr:MULTISPECIES: hypothetical protein [Hymenobacter]MBB4599517.1 hypothetical protein [Hymenobacter latericoloratus]MBB6058173.1 hypothetical protein [Hymenobacter luteus]
MKTTFKLFFSLLIYLLASEANAQYISLNELISFRSKDFEELNTILLQKGWRFTEASKETDEEYAVVSWGYRVNSYTTAASAFINLRSAEGYLPSISYQTVDKQYYLLYKKQINAYHMRKIDTVIDDDGQVITRYEGQSYIVKISVGTDELNSIPVYIFNVSRK